MTSRLHVVHALAALLAGALAACGSPAKPLAGCASRAACAATEVCQAGFCQADLAGPAVQGHVPITDAGNVWWGDTIAIDFDEPIDGASVTDSSLLVTGPGGGALARTWEVDGARLLVRLPQPPTDLAAVRLTVTLSGQLRDPAGNALQGAPVTWGFELPVWQAPAPAYDQRAGGGVALSHAVAPDGSVWVARQDTYGPGSPPEVRHATGGEWTNLGRPSRTGSSLFGAGSAIAVDPTGHPLVAFSAANGFSPPRSIYVYRHDGEAWLPVGDALNADPARDARGPRLRLDADGRPVALWTETVGTAQHLFAKRWTGTAWEQVGDEVPTDPARSVTDYVVAAGPAGALSLAFADGASVELRRLSGSAWSSPGQSLASATTGLDLTFDGSGLEVLGFADAAGVQVWRWRVGGPGLPPRFVPHGGVLAASGATPSLAWRPGGRPGQQLVAGAAGTFFGWSGTDWVGLGALPLGTLGVNEGGLLSCVGSNNVGPETYRVSAARFNR